MSGVKVKIEFSFILMLAFSLLLRAQTTLCVLLFASLHESGHLVSLLCLGGKPSGVTFSFYGMAMKTEAGLSGVKELIFLLSGVAVNAIFAAFCIEREVNTALLCVNLLPLYPLDGGRALAVFINEKALKILSALTLTALFLTAVYLKNFSLLLIAVYILIYSFCEGFR